MSSKAPYMDQYLDDLETLPVELQRNLTLMRELDALSHDKIHTVDRLAEEYLVKVDTLSREKQEEETAAIRSLFKKALDIGDDKIQLATQTYEMVDRHIRRLDADLARFEAGLKDSAALHSRDIESILTQRKKGRKATEKDKKKVYLAESDVGISNYMKRKFKQQPPSQPGAVPVSTTEIINHPSDGFDMPVDPNEPTYCYCHQVSYGEMIGCDNPDCLIEWFHFACVGLTSKPKGKWYCSNCIMNRKKTF